MSGKPKPRLTPILTGAVVLSGTTFLVAAQTVSISGGAPIPHITTAPTTATAPATSTAPATKPAPATMKTPELKQVGGDMAAVIPTWAAPQ